MFTPRSRRRCEPAVALCFALVVIAGCSGGPPVTTFGETPTTTPKVTLTIEVSRVGPILATARGYTLYDFVPDSPTTSRCVNAACVFLWPPLLVQGRATAGIGLKQSLVATIERPDGATQVTYGGHPLYTWNGDTSAGEVTGQALDNEGGYWYVLSPSGQQITTAFSQTGSG
jgi:predicted lipoprotein with Yx(FWY)xxD motif